MPLDANLSAAPVVTRSGAGLFQRRVVVPLLDLLRVGATPRKLAWSLALGVVIGVNPLLGSTTLLCLLLAWLFRLNLLASQIANHLVYPLELALFLFFIRIGNLVFHTGGLPLDRKALTMAIRQHPLETTRLLWSWEWHALLVWLAFAAVVTPLLALMLHPALNRLLHSLHTQPVMEK